MSNEWAERNIEREGIKKNPRLRALKLYLTFRSRSHIWERASRDDSESLTER